MSSLIKCFELVITLPLLQYETACLGKMDLELHRRFAKEPSGELDAIISEIQDTYVAKLDPPFCNVRFFTQLFSSSVNMLPPTTPTSGRGAGRRCLTRFKRGVMSADGMDFRKKI